MYPKEARFVNWSFTSPATATTSTPSEVNGPNSDEAYISDIAKYLTLRIDLSYAAGPTGGALDIYLQVSPDGGTTWYDYAHFTQIAAGGAAAQENWVLDKSGNTTLLTTIGKGTSPALAAGTATGGEWTDHMRVLASAGVSTSAGAAITLHLYFSE